MRSGEPVDGVTTGGSRNEVHHDNPVAASNESEPIDDVTRAFVDGDCQAVRAVYGALVHTFCRRALGADRAADATQFVFTDVWRNRLHLDPDQGTRRRWVMGIARVEVLGALRIAERTGVPLGSAMSDIRRGRERLRPEAGVAG